MLAFFVALALPQGPAPIDLDAVLDAAPSMTAHAAILKAPAEHRLQILVGVPVTGDDGRTTLVRSRLGDPKQYFYPASSVKLCAALALLLELDRLNAANGTAHGLDSEWRIGTRFDGDAVFDRDASNLDGGRATIRHDLRKMLLVSDNLAYNHCLEVLGADGLNKAMWGAGMRSTRLWHRLSEAHTLQENLQTRPVTLRTGEVVTELPAREASVELSNEAFTGLQLGTGYMSDGELVATPMSFAQKNAISLEDLQDVLVEVVRPEIDTGKP
ncbi:MAG: serine hydrolase, partial [Planctomycetes bacterium]|nr:serine hydrolase [Planctomycetota bacterium]